MGPVYICTFLLRMPKKKKKREKNQDSDILYLGHFAELCF